MKTKLVIFGISGDLSTRKLLPALSEIVRETNPDLSIIGVSRRDIDVKELLDKADASNLAERTSVFKMDLIASDDYVRLKDELALTDNEQALMYLSVPPNAAADIVDFLGQAGLNGPNIKILFEKPFGYDLASAREFIERTAASFTEAQLYRIDHYMAKELAKELISLRRDARNKHHGWDHRTVAAIDIVASETLGVEERSVFYEQTGALRDFIQGHLMQLLALMIMDIPADFPLEALPEHRLAALEGLIPADPRSARRAQYAGYGEDVDNPGSLTETFALVRLESAHPRWQGVPFTLLTGKKMDRKRSAITVTYTDSTQETFEEGALLKAERIPDAYERVLQEAIGGTKALFTTSPEVLRSWEVLAPVQQAWAMDDEPLPTYEQGSAAGDIAPDVV